MNTSVDQVESGQSESGAPGPVPAASPRHSPHAIPGLEHGWPSRLRSYFIFDPLIYVFGAMRDKAISEMTEILFPLAYKVIATRPKNPRSASAEEIQQAGSRTGTEIEAVAEVAVALERARGASGPGTVIVVTGSIYLVGEVMRLLGVRT